MKPRSLILVLSTLFTGSLVTGGNLISEALARDVDAFSIKQKHNFLGKMTVTASGDSLRIDDREGLGFVLVTKAPDWTVNIFRDKDRIILTESFSAFATTGLVTDLIMPPKEPAPRGEGAGEKRKIVLGFPASFIQVPSSFEFLPRSKEIDKRIPIVISSAYRTHPVDGFPLSEVSVLKQDLVANNLMKNHHQIDLLTTSIEKVKVPVALFDVPKGYARAKSLQEAVSGPNSLEQFEDVKDMLGADPSHK